IGAVLTMKASFSPTQGRALTVSFRAGAAYHKALRQPIKGKDDIIFPAMEAAPLTLLMRKVFVQHVDIGDGDDWKHRLHLALAEAFSPFGEIAKITMPLTSYKDVSFYQTNAIVYLSMKLETDDQSTPSELTVPHWGQVVGVNWDGTPPCNFCSRNGHDRMDCPARLALVC
ncbi:hypothetical protein BGX28_002084, partial [Mortierella sp. GBA30]